jgi:hypothetical protein
MLRRIKRKNRVLSANLWSSVAAPSVGVTVFCMNLHVKCKFMYRASTLCNFLYENAPEVQVYVLAMQLPHLFMYSWRTRKYARVRTINFWIKNWCNLFFTPKSIYRRNPSQWKSEESIKFDSLEIKNVQKQCVHSWDRHDVNLTKPIISNRSR